MYNVTSVDFLFTCIILIYLRLFSIWNNCWQVQHFCCRPSGVERLAITSAAGYELQTFQACTERIMFKL